MSQHTPGPWRLSKRQISPQGILSDDWGPIAEAVGGYSAEEKDANMRHIVHCVNTHDHLLAALEAQEEAELARTIYNAAHNNPPAGLDAMATHMKWVDDCQRLLDRLTELEAVAKGIRTAALAAAKG